MKDWLDSLQPRERVMVATAAVFVLFAVFWFAVWKPLDDAHKSVATDVANWQDALAALRPLKGQLPAPGAGQPVAAPNQSLVVIVDTTLRQRGLYNALQRSQPTPDGDGIRVEFEAAAFDDLVLWLGDLHRLHGMSVQSGSFSVASGDSPGRVNSSISLER